MVKISALCFLKMGASVELSWCVTLRQPRPSTDHTVPLLHSLKSTENKPTWWNPSLVRSLDRYSIKLDACLLSSAQTDPTRLPVSLLLCCSAAPLPPPVLTPDLCPGDRRHQYVEISFWHGPVASVTMWPRENKYGCLFGGSVRGPPAVAALKKESFLFPDMKYQDKNRTLWFFTVLLAYDAVILRDRWQDIKESQN